MPGGRASLADKRHTLCISDMLPGGGKQIKRTPTSITADPIDMNTNPPSSDFTPGKSPPVALIVGGTRGIGKAMALELIRRGYAVNIVGRPSPRGSANAAAIGARFWAADVSRTSEVRRLAERFSAEHSRLDLLIHSADVLRYSRADSSEGVELSFAINYLSRFVLNRRLLPLLRVGGDGRIVHVAAAGMPGSLDLEQIPPAPRETSFSGHNTGQRANDVHVLELIEREASVGIKAFGFNPGLVDTEIRDHIEGMPWWLRLVMHVMSAFIRPVPTADSAAMILRIVLDPSAESGLFDRRGRRLSLRRRESMAREQHLWARSEELLGRLAPHTKSRARPAPPRGRSLTGGSRSRQGCRASDPRVAPPEAVYGEPITGEAPSSSTPTRARLRRRCRRSTTVEVCPEAT